MTAPQRPIPEPLQKLRELLGDITATIMYFADGNKPFEANILEKLLSTIGPLLEVTRVVESNTMGDYKVYLSSSQWSGIRARVMSRDRHTCCSCGKRSFVNPRFNDNNKPKALTAEALKEWWDNNKNKTVDWSKVPKESFHVHHITYERRGWERLEDLVLLCPECHEMIHARGLFEGGSYWVPGVEEKTQ